MGLSASQARLVLLSAKEANDQFKSQNIQEERMRISNEVQRLLQMKQGGGIFPPVFLGQGQDASSNEIMNSMKNVVKGQGSSMMDNAMEMLKKLLSGGGMPGPFPGPDIDVELARLQEMDKNLEIQLKQLDTQIKATQTEEEAVQKVIDKDIKGTFGLCAGVQ